MVKQWLFLVSDNEAVPRMASEPKAERVTKHGWLVGHQQMLADPLNWSPSLFINIMKDAYITVIRHHRTLLVGLSKPVNSYAWRATIAINGYLWAQSIAAHQVSITIVNQVWLLFPSEITMERFLDHAWQALKSHNKRSQSPQSHAATITEDLPPSTHRSHWGHCMGWPLKSPGLVCMFSPAQ